MPIYCYKRPDGRIVEALLPISASRAKEFICEDGVVATRSLAAEGRGTRENLNAGHWPHVSTSAGINPDQLAEMKSEFPHHDFTPDGDMIFRNPRHMERCLKDIGMVPLGKTP